MWFERNNICPDLIRVTPSGFELRIDHGGIEKISTNGDFIDNISLDVIDDSKGKEDPFNSSEITELGTEVQRLKTVLKRTCAFDNKVIPGPHVSVDPVSSTVYELENAYLCPFQGGSAQLGYCKRVVEQTERQIEFVILVDYGVIAMTEDLFNVAVLVSITPCAIQKPAFTRSAIQEIDK